jgi:hypothetical protein
MSLLTLSWVWRVCGLAPINERREADEDCSVWEGWDWEVDH